MFRRVPVLGLPVHPSNNLAVCASLLEQSGQLDLFFQRGFRTGFSSLFYDEVRCLCLPLPGKVMMFFHHHKAKAKIIGRVSEKECKREVPDMGNPLDLLFDAKCLSCFQFIEINSGLVTPNNCLIGLK